MIEKVKITFIDDTTKIIEVEDKDIQLSFNNNEIDVNKIKGIDKVGD